LRVGLRPGMRRTQCRSTRSELRTQSTSWPFSFSTRAAAFRSFSSCVTDSSASSHALSPHCVVDSSASSHASSRRCVASSFASFFHALSPCCVADSSASSAASSPGDQVLLQRRRGHAGRPLRLRPELVAELVARRRSSSLRLRPAARRRRGQQKRRRRRLTRIVTLCSGGRHAATTTTTTTTTDTATITTTTTTTTTGLLSRLEGRGVAPAAPPPQQCRARLHAPTAPVESLGHFRGFRGLRDRP
jgi:hypothetical protein